MEILQLKIGISLMLLVIDAVVTEIVMRVDPLALLSATLRTYQKAACDTDQIAIACPRGTSISIEFAQYNKFIAKDGINIEDLCTVSGDDNKERSRAKYLLRGSTFGAPVQKVLPNRYANAVYLPEMAITVNDITNGTTPLNAQNNEEQIIENCQWPHSLQYSLLQTVVEACQKKKHCKFGRPQFYGMGASGVGDTTGTSSYHSSTVTSNTINVDPCPKKRKIVEVSYKCRPYEFRSKVACHNDVAQLECNPYSRIAVYSASFGRTEYESIQCPQPQGVREETCLASYSTETVMQICHGRRRCNLAADANTFGTPCQPNSKMYLKVVYTCVPKQVLMERYESEMEADEPEDFDGDINELYDDEYYKESEAIPKLYSNTTAIATRNSDNGTTFNTLLNPLNKAINGTLLTIDSDAGSSNPVMTHSADLILEDNQERVFFYLLSIGSIGVIVCVVIVLARFVVLRRVVLTNNSHLTNTVKGGNDMEVGRTGDSTVNISIGETVIPNVYNDSMPEVSADINLVTAMSMPSVSKNENYINYGPTSSLYGLCNNLLPPPSSAGTVVPSPALHLAGTAQSPDILNAAAQKYSPANSSPTISSTPLNAAIVISAAGCSTISSSTVIGAVVPITSLAQYTTAPTFRSGYIINTENILQRPPNTMPSTISITRAEAYLNLNQKYSQQQQHQLQLLKQHQLPPQQMEMGKSGGSSAITTAATYNTLRHYKSPSLSTPPVLQSQPLATSTPSAYDGTLPRTLPTGMPVNSPFYYG